MGNCRIGLIRAGFHPVDVLIRPIKLRVHFGFDGNGVEFQKIVGQMALI